MEVVYKEINIESDKTQIIELYISVGWTAYTNDESALLRGIENSLLSIGAYVEEELIGLIRIIGDAETVIYIQDILVQHNYQRKGIASQLINMVKSRYENVRQMLLMTDRKDNFISFYEQNGFEEVGNRGLVSFIRRDSEQG